MKYIRKPVVVILVVLFCIALAISAAMATAVKNVNLSYYDGTGAYTDEYNKTLENLNNLKGSNMMLIDKEDVVNCISDSARISLVSYEKSYPCTINVVLSERIETFYSLSDGVCYVYDEDCSFMYTSSDIVGGSEEEGYVLSETADLSPNVIIDHDTTDDEKTFISKSSETFKKKFGSLRRIVKSITLEKTPEYEYKNLIFVMRSGVKVEITNGNDLTEEKISSAYSLYLTLTDGQKTSGKIHVYTQENSEGTVKSVYTP